MPKPAVSWPWDRLNRTFHAPLPHAHPTGLERSHQPVVAVSWPGGGHHGHEHAHAREVADMSLLRHRINLLASLDPASGATLRAVLADPNTATWEAARDVVVAAPATTLYEAVQTAASTLPPGPLRPDTGWIPDQVTIARALRDAVDAEEAAT